MACVNALKPDMLTACHCLAFFPLYAGEARLRRPPYARYASVLHSPKQPISATAEQHDQDQEEEQQLASLAEASAVAKMITSSRKNSGNSQPSFSPRGTDRRANFHRANLL